MSGQERVIGNRAFRSARGLFWRRWFANPLRIGAVAPSGPALARRMAREVVLRDGEAVVEFGPGTGNVTSALIEAGVPEDRLVLVEWDTELHAYLTERFPDATVIHGDAAELGAILPRHWRGRVSAVVSSLPLQSFGVGKRKRIVEAAFSVMGRRGRFIQYTYFLRNPVHRAVPHIRGRRTGFAVFNLPPATVWRYTAAEAAGAEAPKPQA